MRPNWSKGNLLRLKSFFTHAHRMSGAIGVANAFVGSGLSASALCCQKWAHLHPENGVYYKQKVWMLGCVLIGLGGMSSIANYALLGQSSQAPFAALTLIYNAMLSNFVLEESMTKIDGIASFIIVVGVGICLALADFSNETYTLDELLDLYANFGAFIYTLCVVSYLLILAFVVNVVLRPSSNFSLLRIIIFDAENPLRLLLFGTGAGFQAGFSGLFLKASVEIVTNAIKEGNRDMGSLCTYVFVLAGACSLFIQLFLINQGLSYFDALQFVPIYQAFIILANLCCGLFFFREYEEYSTSHLVGFILGCVTTSAGVLVLVLKKAKTEDCQDTPDLEAKLLERARADSSYEVVHGRRRSDSVVVLFT